MLQRFKREFQAHGLGSSAASSNVTSILNVLEVVQAHVSSAWAWFKRMAVHLAHDGSLTE
jgi:hypothetical protein